LFKEEAYGNLPKTKKKEITCEASGLGFKSG
jgi:hypothetical protein